MRGCTPLGGEVGDALFQVLALDDRETEALSLRVPILASATKSAVLSERHSASAWQRPRARGGRGS